jgi:hypothetical protein
MPIIKASKCRAEFFAWLLLFFSAVFTPATAQRYFFDNYGIKQGLSEQKVYALLQDSKDYIWLGTPMVFQDLTGKNLKTSQPATAWLPEV